MKVQEIANQAATMLAFVKAGNHEDLIEPIVRALEHLVFVDGASQEAVLETLDLRVDLLNSMTDDERVEYMKREMPKLFKETVE